MKSHIGVVGAGFVGRAIVEYFQNKHPVMVWDIVPELQTVGSLDELVKNSEFIFLAVPTPMRPDGTCDTTAVRNVLVQIDSISQKSNIVSTVILKSTVPIGTTASVQTKNMSVLFNPEFLTERNASADFAEQDRIILGIPTDYEAKSVTKFFKKWFPRAQLRCVPPAQAELLKYVTNSFLALKVAFANQVSQYADTKHIEWSDIVDLLKLDARMGDTHWDVPGPDGKYGFGGSCFPKDVNSFLTQGLYANVEMTILQAAWESNLQVRPERDWELLKKRAVV